MNLPANEGSTAEFDDFVASGEVEVSPGAKSETSKEKEPAGDENQGDNQGADQGDDGEDQSGNVNDQGDDQDGDDQDGKEKPQKTPRDHQIERLKREKAELARQLREANNGEISKRLEALEKGLSNGNTGVNQDAGTPAPDPTDVEKYPLGYLDDRYQEDKLEWLAEKLAAKQADTVLQRQQEQDQSAAAERQAQELIEKVDTLSTRGTELYEDFHESVIESGMRGDWNLTQTTFEAAYDAENGGQILYELSQNKAEADRVSKLSPYQQLQFVAKRDAEISQGKTPRRIPKADAPPEHNARGANSRTQINPATDDLDAFEKLWAKTPKQ